MTRITELEIDMAIEHGFKELLAIRLKEAYGEIDRLNMILLKSEKEES